jgi:ATP-dependent DNA helicase RecG
LNWNELQVVIETGETLQVEFKSDRKKLSDHNLIDVVVCLANAQGGTLLLGVEDDGRLTGLHPDHRTNPQLLASLIASRTVPPLNVTVNVVTPLDNTIQVAALQIPTSTQPVASSDGRLLIRYLDTKGNPGCRPLYPNELQSWHANRGQTDTTTQLIPDSSWDDFDPLEFARLRRMIEQYHGDTALLPLSDEEISRALGLAVWQNKALIPTIAGILLVGRESALQSYLPTHEVAFQVLQETDVLVNDFYRWPLLRLIERIVEAFIVRNEERELNWGLFRVAVPAYDPRGFREALNNALIHRDYLRLGAVHVQLHTDRLIISNPGGFVEGVRPDNILTIDPRPRNPRLADCFKRIGLVERTGRGVSIIYNGQLRNGRPAPNYTQSTETGVSVTLYGGPADLDFVQFVVSEENRQGRLLSVSELLVLDYVRQERDLDTVTAAALIQRPEPETRTILESLVENGLLERRGTRRARTYHLSAGIYRQMGQPSAYVHTRGFEPLQMETMIRQYVQAHGRITRRDVIELCRVSANQAGHLLKKLVHKNDLELVSMGRNSYYRPKKAN